MRKKHGIIFLLGLVLLPYSVVQAKLTLPAELQGRFADTQLVYNGLELKAPAIAENGAVVNVGISKARLPSANVHIKHIEVYTAYNLTKPVYVLRLGKTSVAEGLRTRIKIAKTTQLYAFAHLSNGQVMVTSKKVKVTIGGCGGGADGVVNGA